MKVAERKLPTLDPPDEDIPHIKEKNGWRTFCGARGGAHSKHGGWRDENKTHCACGEPVCPSCLLIRQVWRDSGCWEGP